MDKDKEQLSIIAKQLEAVKEIIDHLVESIKTYLRK